MNLGFPCGIEVKDLPANAGDAKRVDLIPGLGRSLGVGNDNPLQYSCVENSTNRGAWQATVHGGSKESATTGQQKELKEMNLEDIMLTEISQTKEEKNCVISFLCRI